MMPVKKMSDLFTPIVVCQHISTVKDGVQTAMFFPIVVMMKQVK